MRCRRIVLAAAAVCALAVPGRAQEPPAPIPRFAVDVHALVPAFPHNVPLADSRGLNLAELPGVGFGGDIAVHVYPARWRAVTFGIGGRFTMARAHSAGDPAAGLRPVTEHLTYLAPQISFNFGSAAGWSYLSGGISGATWSIVPDGGAPLPSDQQRLKALDYGGGARWFAKPHLAFSFDVRLYALNPTAPSGALPSGPRTTILVIGAGVSLK